MMADADGSHSPSGLTLPNKVFSIQSPERLVLPLEPGDAVIRGPRNLCDDNTRASSWCQTEEHRHSGSWPQITRVILIHG